MYDSRVKGLHYQNEHLASISSDGDITVWTVDIDEQKVTELCTTNIGCRPICLTIVNLGDFADEYILKRENTYDEIAAETVSSKHAANTSKNVGKVIIEADDDDEKMNKSSKFEMPSTSVSIKKKRKSLPASLSSAKKSKLKRLSVANLRNKSGFLEEDM